MDFAKYVSEFPNKDTTIEIDPCKDTKRIVLDKSDDDSRPKSIVSSYNVAAVLGFDSWTTAEQEFEFKVGLKTKKANDAMSHGQTMESVAAQKFSDFSGRVLFKVPVVVCKENKYICAYLDRITEDGINVEIKVPFSQVVVEDSDLEYVKTQKASYYHQMQLQMHVLDLKETLFVQYGGPPNKFHTVNPLSSTKFPPREVLSVVSVPKDPEWWPTHKKTIFDFIDRVLLYQKIKKSGVQ